MEKDNFQGKKIPRSKLVASGDCISSIKISVRVYGEVFKIFA